MHACLQLHVHDELKLLIPSLQVCPQCAPGNFSNGGIMLCPQVPTCRFLQAQRMDDGHSNKCNRRSGLWWAADRQNYVCSQAYLGPCFFNWPRLRPASLMVVNGGGSRHAILMGTGLNCNWTGFEWLYWKLVDSCFASQSWSQQKLPFILTVLHSVTDFKEGQLRNLKKALREWLGVGVS